ncbi:MAG: outer membrane beta-barrel protein [Bacteroidaceae bacterium]|nr:outer membrane beta-barrel protein [Bacteroidaceae bacterium]
MKHFIITTITLLMIAGNIYGQHDSIKYDVNLKEIVVKSMLPRTKVKPNSIETRIVGSILEHAGSAEDVLAKIPGMIRQGNTLEVIGRGEPIYYINNRRVHDAEELKRINSEQIKSIDVINNPGSEYDSNVSAVVKIKTIRKQGEGISVDLKSQIRQTLITGKTDPGTSIDLNYRHKNWDVFGGTSLWTYHYTQENVIGGGTYTKALTHEQTGIVNNQQHSLGLQYKLGANWQVNENHSVGIMAQLYHNPYVKGVTLTNEEVKRNSEYEDHVIADDCFEVLRHRGISTNVYYSGMIGKWNIDWNCDLAKQTHHEKNNIYEQGHSHDNHLYTEGCRQNEVYATKFVLAHPLGKGLLKLGTEDFYVISKNKYSTHSNLLPNANSKVRELTLAAFAEYSLSVPMLGQLVAGLRYEHLSMNYDDMLDVTKNQQRKLDNLFPSITWNRAFGSWSLNLNYAVRTRRPTYWQMRNAMEYHSRYIYEAGNPQLRNTINQTLSLTGNYKWLVLGIDYLHAAHKIQEWAEPYNNEGTVVLRMQNLAKPVQSYSIYTIVHPTWGCWSPNYTIGITQQFLTLDLADDRESSGIRTTSFNHPMFLFYANNAFRIPSGQSQPWQLELNLQYRSRMNHDNGEMRRCIWSLDAAVQKSFLAGNLTFRLSANDLLRHMQEDAFVDYGNYLVYQFRDLKNQALEFSVHYRFNATKSKYRGAGAGQDAKSRIK